MKNAELQKIKDLRTRIKKKEVFKPPFAHDSETNHLNVEVMVLSFCPSGLFWIASNASGKVVSRAFWLNVVIFRAKVAHAGIYGIFLIPPRNK